MEEDEEVLKTPGFAWRVSLSIIVGVGWLVFLILWVTFYAATFTLPEHCNCPCLYAHCGCNTGCGMGVMGHKIRSKMREVKLIF